MGNQSISTYLKYKPNTNKEDANTLNMTIKYKITESWDRLRNNH